MPHKRKLSQTCDSAQPISLPRKFKNLSPRPPPNSLYNPNNPIYFMKPINEMSAAEIGDYLIAKNLRELHDRYRWIPVEERLPTEEDGEQLLGRVLWMSIHGYVEAQNWAQQPDWAVWWQRINKPEGV